MEIENRAIIIIPKLKLEVILFDSYGFNYLDLLKISEYEIFVIIVKIDYVFVAFESYGYLANYRITSIYLSTPF